MVDQQWFLFLPVALGQLIRLLFLPLEKVPWPEKRNVVYSQWMALTYYNSQGNVNTCSLCRSRPDGRPQTQAGGFALGILLSLHC